MNPSRLPLRSHPSRPSRRLALAVTAAVGLAVGAASLAARAGPSAPSSAPSTAPRYAFSHAEHAARDPSSSCVDCHDARASRPQLGTPTLRVAHCAQCHDELPAIARRTPLSAPLAIRFHHAPHASTACSQCHARVEAPVAEGGARGRAATDVGEAQVDEAQADETRAEHRRTATSATCLACHAKVEGAPREQACAQCHGRDERQVPPASHGSGGASTTWRREHKSSVLALPPHGTSCTLCHKESSCRACHRVERPVDHNNAVWGERMHGVRASFDRQRCKTCHETGQCVGCHRATEPRNHNGAWRATHGLVARTKSDTSCATCHRASFCVDCHRGAR